MDFLTLFVKIGSPNPAPYWLTRGTKCAHADGCTCSGIYMVLGTEPGLAYRFLIRVFYLSRII